MDVDRLTIVIDAALAEAMTEGYFYPAELSYEDGPKLARFLAERIDMDGVIRCG